MALTNRHYKVQMILGESISPWVATFDRLDAMLAKLEDEGTEVPEDVALFFLPAEDNPAQYRIAGERRDAAIRWAKERHGQLPDWLIAAGVVEDVEVEVDTDPEP